MKINKILCLIIAACISAAAAAPASAVENANVSINGDLVELDVQPIIQNGRTLVPARAVFEALGCGVFWSGDVQSVIISKNDVKLIVRIGDNTFYKYIGYDADRLRYQIPKGTVETLQFDEPPQLVGDRTLVPLRALCEALGVSVSWNEQNGEVVLTCGYDFIAEVNTDAEFAEAAFEVLDRFDESRDDIQYKDIQYKDTTPHILVDLGVVSEADFNKGGYITNLEALRTMHFGEITDANLPVWYIGDTFASLDYLDEETKCLLIDFNTPSSLAVLTDEDILNLDLDQNLTYFDALKYITRSIGDTYGCVSYIEELDFTERSQTYQVAYKKDLIDSVDMENADSPIPRSEFYELIHKMIFTEYISGGYYTSTRRIVDTLIARTEKPAEPEEETVVNTTEISASDINIADDLSISWTLPPEYSLGDDFSTSLEIIPDENDHDGYGEALFGGMNTSINAEHFIELLLGAYPDSPEYLRCTYYNYNEDYTVKNEYVLDIDLSDIKIVDTKEDISPGTFTETEDADAIYTITLDGGSSFQKDSYYALKSYRHKFRKPEYNLSSSVIFKADENSDTLEVSKDDIILDQGVYLDEIHIREITVTKSGDSDFTVYISPVSSDVFDVIERSLPSD